MHVIRYQRKWMHRVHYTRAHHLVISFMRTCCLAALRCRRVVREPDFRLNFSTSAIVREPEFRLDFSTSAIVREPEFPPDLLCATVQGEVGIRVSCGPLVAPGTPHEALSHGDPADGVWLGRRDLGSWVIQDIQDAKMLLTHTRRSKARSPALPRGPCRWSRCRRGLPRCSAPS